MGVTLSIKFGQQKVRLLMTLYFLFVHITGVLGAYYMTLCKSQTVIWCLMLWFSGEIGITAGLHRLWSHRSYKAHWTLRVFLMLLITMSNQGTIYEWVRDHRIHHKYSDTDADPHNVRNFMF